MREGGWGELNTLLILSCTFFEDGMKSNKKSNTSVAFEHEK